MTDFSAIFIKKIIPIEAKFMGQCECAGLKEHSFLDRFKVFRRKNLGSVEKCV